MNRKITTTVFLKLVFILVGPLIAAVICVRVTTSAVRMAFEIDLTDVDLRLVSPMTLKTRNLVNWKGRFNGFIVGNSTVAQIDPRFIDLELKKAGIHSISYNLGLGGTTLSESYVGLKAVLDSKMFNLDWVILDTSIPPMGNGNLFGVATAQELFQNTFEEVLFFSLFTTNPLRVLDRWFMYFSRLGSPRYFGGHLTANRKKSSFQRIPLYDDTRGFFTPAVAQKGNRKSGDMKDIREGGMRDQKKFFEGIQILSSQDRRPCDKYRLAMIERFLNEIKKSNFKARIVFLNPPLAERDWTKDCDFEARFGNFTFVNLQNPNRYPELYVVGERWDAFHFRYGALSRFESLVARKVAESFEKN